MTLRTEVKGDFNIHGTKKFWDCCFPSKIKYLWCCKPPEPLVDQKHLFSTWNIDTACYYWKHLKKVFSVITGCVNISCREQVFLAHQRFRRLTTSWIFDFWRKTAYWKYLVPWRLKSPLTSVLKRDTLFLLLFSYLPVKVYKKVVKFSFKQQKLFWVLVVGFMYLVLVRD